MSRTPAILAILAALPLAFVSLAQATPLVPDLVPLALVIVGSLVAAASAWFRRPRVHLAGLVLTLAGAGLTGLSMGWGLIAIGALGCILAVASFGLDIELPDQAGQGWLVVITLLVAVLTALAGVGLVLLLADLGAGGLDARVGIPAWLVIVGAISWLLTRRAMAHQEAEA